MTANMLRKAVVVSASAAALFLGCVSGETQGTISAPPPVDLEVVEDTTPAQNTNPEPTGPICDQGRVYKGFGGKILVAGRTDEMQNVDRLRIKPYGVLAGEYQRVLGKTPQLLGSLGSTFSQPPARWFEEPGASAVTLYSAYRLGFVACLDLTASGETYAAAPTEESATAICSDLSRKFWSRTPTADEVATCVNVATVDTQKETNPRRRWAYTCASLLSSAGFLAY